MCQERLAPLDRETFVAHNFPRVEVTDQVAPSDNQVVILIDILFRFKCHQHRSVHNEGFHKTDQPAEFSAEKGCLCYFFAQLVVLLPTSTHGGQVSFDEIERTFHFGQSERIACTAFPSLFNLALEAGHIGFPRNAGGRVSHSGRVV
jgi:hypothetical protein